MKLKPFGENKDATFTQPSLGDCSGYLQELIQEESERPMTIGGALQMRIDLVQYADELLQVADNADPKIMRATLEKLKALDSSLGG